MLKRLRGRFADKNLSRPVGTNAAAPGNRNWAGGHHTLSRGYSDMREHVQKRVAKPKQITRQQRRKEAGLWLRRLREERGLSQRELADKVGVEVYTLISQLEGGRGLIPQDRQLLWADALEAEPREFVRRLASYYNPRT